MWFTKLVLAVIAVMLGMSAALIDEDPPGSTRAKAAGVAVITALTLAYIAGTL